MTRRLQFAVLTMTAIVASSTLKAEQTIYLLVGSQSCTVRCMTPHVVEIDIEGQRLVGQYPATGTAQQMFALADGRFLYWLEAGLTTGTALNLFYPALRTTFRAPGPHGEASPHPSELKAFAHHGNSIAVVDGSGVVATFLLSPCESAYYLFYGLSGSGNRILLQCAGVGSPRSVILDSSTGTVIAVLPGVFGEATLDETGQHLFLLRHVADTTRPGATIHRYDVTTGNEVASSSYDYPFGTAGPGELFIERRTDRVFVTRSNEVLVFDPVSLALQGRLAYQHPPTYIAPRAVFDPNKGAAFVLAHEFPSAGTVRAYLNVIDTDALTLTATVALPYTDPVWDIAIPPYPTTPTGLTAVVAGSRVTLSWARGPRSPYLTNYVFEVGSTSGAANLARLATPTAATTFTVDDVPAGTYYVRVRGQNYAGLSPASNEIVVTVGGAARGAAGRQR